MSESEIHGILTIYSTFEENWDSYGGLKPSHDAIEIVRQLIVGISKNVVETVVPGSNGEICIVLTPHNGTSIQIIVKADKSLRIIEDLSEIESMVFISDLKKIKNERIRY